MKWNDFIPYKDLLGKPFQYSSCGPDSFDCKGLMVELCKRKKLVFPNYESSSDPTIQATRFIEGLEKYSTKIDIPEQGDFVMFMLVPPYVTHIGMMMDRTHFIHITKGTSVSIESVTSLIWKNKIAGYYRMIV